MTQIAAIKIRHTHGLTESFPSIEDAERALREVYGDEVVIYTADGGEGLTEEGLQRGRALAWSCEADSVDDDGARAVASLSASWDD